MALQDDVKRIIDATDIVALVSSYNIKLEKQGKNYRGLCPFHNEDTPSFLVSPDKKLAHCFGCQGGGDPIKFIMQMEGITFPEAISKLAEFNGIEYKSNYQKKEDPNKKYYQILNLAISFYKANYEKTEFGKQAREYLIKRGLTDDVIKDFNVGLSPKQKDSLFKVLSESGYLELDMVDSGLINEQNGSYHDFFVNRIMFPIYDESNNPIGFSARIFENDPNQPKYINSKESMIYHKGEVLFNIQNAKAEIIRKKRVILHEGQMDVIASYRSGLKEAICTMGTALTITQAKLLKKYTDTAIICYDGDKAGIKASLKAIKIFKQVGINTRLVLLPNNMDPDEYVLKYGTEAYKNFFESNIIDSLEYTYKTSLIGIDFNDNIIFKSLCDNLFSILINETSESIKESYIKRLSEDANKSYDALMIDFNNYRTLHSSRNVNIVRGTYDNSDDYFNEPVETKQIAKEDKYDIAELRLIKYALSSKSNAEYINGRIEDSDGVVDGMNGFSENVARIWMKLVDEYYKVFNTFETNKFLALLNSDEMGYFLKIVEEAEKSKFDLSQEDMISCIDKVLKNAIKNENKRLQKEINKRDSTMPPTEKDLKNVNAIFNNRNKLLKKKKK